MSHGGRGVPKFRFRTPESLAIARGDDKRYHTLSKMRGIGMQFSDFREPDESSCGKCGLTGAHVCINGIYELAASRPGAE